MLRKILAFFQDREHHWVARLDCGHGRHLRHDPPFFDRAWVEQAERRADQLGKELDCPACDRSEMPADWVAYKRTPVFNKDSIPKGLMTSHRTRPGVWARIRCPRGRLEYRVEAPVNQVMVLDPQRDGIVIPGVTHRIRPLGEVSVFVEFYRGPEDCV